ncbi:reverse transcriptase family protein [Planococcus sp. SE5232]|uniref:reverse transcriptase family protein n=1 Tax=unclassified Planococcus (in: firmicutes) TaxID=2662419 RepID=UPI003D6B2BB8
MFIYQGDFFYKYILSTTKNNTKLLKQEEVSNAYSLMHKPKRNGVRKIQCLKKDTELYVLQKKLLHRFLESIPLSESCYGFVKGRSYFDFLNKHTYPKDEVRHFLKVDIKDFFHSISSDKVAQSLSHYIKTDSIEENREILRTINRIVTLDSSLPQGAVTSPCLSNIVFRRIDIRLLKYCERFNVKYTRYADDLLFSSESNVVLKAFFLNTLKKILKENHFDINFMKVRKSSQEIRFNGYVVGDQIRLSRKKTASLNRVLYICDNETTAPKILSSLKTSEGNNDRHFYTIESLIRYLNGHRSFLIGFKRFQKDKIRNSKVNNQIKNIEKSVLQLSQL